MLDEQKIISDLKNSLHKERAFTLLIREYQEPLYWQIRHMVTKHEDADDILQNTFLKAWSAIDAFRGDSKISTWLFRIAVNETLTFLEKEKKIICTDIDTSAIAQHLQSDNYFDGDATQLQLQEAINQLPDKQRLVFNLKYFQEMKYEEMSAILGTSIGALKASYHHAIRKITDFFENTD